MRYVNETNYTLRKAEIRHLVTMQVWERGNKYSTCRPGGTFSNLSGRKIRINVLKKWDMTRSLERLMLAKKSKPLKGNVAKK